MASSKLRLQKGQLYMVKWVDASSLAMDWTQTKEWEPANELDVLCTTVGYYAHTITVHGKEGVLIYQTKTKESLCHAKFIPIGMITDVRTLSACKVPKKI